MIRNFEYRLPRITTGFRVEFKVNGDILRGLCRDFTEAGIRAELDGAVVVGSVGTVILRYASRVLEVEAQVAYLERHQTGLVFLDRTGHDRDEALQLMTLLAK